MKLFVLALSAALLFSASSEAQERNSKSLFSKDFDLLKERIKNGKNFSFSGGWDDTGHLEELDASYCKRFVQSVRSKKAKQQPSLPVVSYSTETDGDSVVREKLLDEGGRCQNANPLQTLDKWYSNNLNNRRTEIYVNLNYMNFLVAQFFNGKRILLGSFYKTADDSKCFRFEESDMFEDLKGVTLFEKQITIFASGETDLKCESERLCRNDLDGNHKWFLRLYPPNLGANETLFGEKRESPSEESPSVTWNVRYICSAYFD
jgi:hypothetical protein